MKVIIEGSRGITNPGQAVEDAIRASGFDITEVVSGTCAGIVRAGEAWAFRHCLPIKVFPAKWSEYGKSAGPIRNISMAHYADALIAVWDGKSKGTHQMIEAAKDKGIPVYVHRCRETR